MSSSRPGYHQDYIARIRYTNALPPPPFAPKLLEIGNSGLSNGVYTSASFASRLAREQPLNIEADAELGMKIDLVGLPGVFDGDESAIMFPDRPPPLDPKDRVLLRPLASLGKSSAAPSNVSFLRRTEYMTGHKSADPTSTSRPSNILRTGQAKKPFVRPKSADNKNDPAAMLRTIEKSFNLAYPKDAYSGPDTMQHIRGSEITRAEREAWEKPRHPTNPDLRLLDSYPIIPDIAALGDSGSYFLIKYKTNPSSISSHYDTRLDYTVLVPNDTDEEITRYNEDLVKWEADPERNKKPQLKTSYIAFVPDNETTGDSNNSKDGNIVSRLKRKFDIYNPDNDSSNLYTHGLDSEMPDDETEEPENDPYFRFKKLRIYETYLQTGAEGADGDAEDAAAKWNDNIALALHDTVRDADNDDAVARGTAPPRQKAAYIYPINQRQMIRPKRPTAGAGAASRGGFGMVGSQQQQQQQDGEEEQEDGGADVLELRIGEPGEEEMVAMESHRMALDSTLAQQQQQQQAATGGGGVGAE